MKVNIGRYIKWWGPYQLAELIPFISKDTQHNVGEWLANTWVNDFCQWIDSKKKRKEYVRIDNYDTWNMDHTLALIILPMLKQIQNAKHGTPYVDDEDVPPHMRYGDSIGYDNWMFYKWEWILKEMIFAFESIVDDSWENKFFHDKNGEHRFDKEGFNLYNERIANGLRLFGKYFRALWT